MQLRRRKIQAKFAKKSESFESDNPLAAMKI